MQQSLDLFLAKHELPVSEDECLEMVNAAGHGKCLKAVHETFFVSSDSKKYVVWLNGVTSSGKTKFIDRMNLIFNC